MPVLSRRSSRGEKGEEEGRDGDDALNESDNEEEEEEEEEEEGDLWQAVHRCGHLQVSTAKSPKAQKRARRGEKRAPISVKRDILNPKP